MRSTYNIKKHVAPAKNAEYVRIILRARVRACATLLCYDSIFFRKIHSITTQNIIYLSPRHVKAVGLGKNNKKTEKTRKHQLLKARKKQRTPLILLPKETKKAFRSLAINFFFYPICFSPRGIYLFLFIFYFIFFFTTERNAIIVVSVVRKMEKKKKKRKKKICTYLFVFAALIRVFRRTE